MARLEFLPNSPTLMNAGTELGQLSACFVLPVDDDMESIFSALKNMALVQRSGGGTGFSFSRLRPKGDVVTATGGIASGPVSFMKIFDAATENIKQGGKRRGANMGILRVDHPDIREFIHSKEDERTLQNFNISVAVTDAFMFAVERNDEWALINPRTQSPVGRIPARTLFQEIVDSAWKTGDPGLVFIDAINRHNPTPNIGTIESTNPCGEVPLLPYESCNLGSINLSKFIREHQGRPSIDWEGLRTITEDAVRFLDDVIEVNRYPIPEIEKATKGNRKIGLGVMGFAEALVRLGISYESEEAARVAEEIMSFIMKTAIDTSARLAEERGVFPNWAESIYPPRNEKRRNATLTAIAPTGTISIIANTSASIEPFFALAYRRTNVLGGQTLWEVNPLLLEYLERYGIKWETVAEEIQNTGSLKEVASVPDELKRLFITALELEPVHHLAIQSAFQKHVDNSVSKTVNLPQNATPQDVWDVYWRAWTLGLKGVTIYRYHSKSSQVLELGVEEEPEHYDHASKCDPYECRV
jgi:ribonucleoside-diphosphate reductase alpha chain